MSPRNHTRVYDYRDPECPTNYDPVADNDEYERALESREEIKMLETKTQ